jgi:glycosyltransferase involved in cell wall biosynthesis
LLADLSKSQIVFIGDEMNYPMVSVIIPSYNHGHFVSKAICSVLNQTFNDFEVLVVDDGSTDNTSEIVHGLPDARIKYIHQENRGLPAARNTGIKASSGKFLAFLDSDDSYHPEKLATLVDFLERQPEIGVGYNARFMVNSRGECQFLQRVPLVVYLKDLLTGYPITPSDVVMRKEWAFKVGLYDESFILNSEDLNFHLRLALNGCRFAGVDRALNYRQIHANRNFKSIPGKLETYLRALETVFSDPSCPPEIMDLKDQAFGKHYLTWAYQASIQGEVNLSREYIREAIRLDPGLILDDGKPILKFLIHASIRDGEDHETRLVTVFKELPEELEWMSRHLEWAITQGYLWRGLQDMMWERTERGANNLSIAISRTASLDETTLHKLADQLVGYQIEFGTFKTRKLIHLLSPYLQQLGKPSQVRWLKAYCAINQAYRNYRHGNYKEVPSDIFYAIRWNPVHAMNKGTISTLTRSLAGLRKTSKPFRE